MKTKLSILIALLAIPVLGIPQGYTGDYFRARNYMKAPIFFQDADTLATKAFVRTFPFVKGSGTAGYIPYFTSASSLANSPLQVASGNVTASGKVEATNMETNSTSLTTRLGIGSGANEDETSACSNVFIGYQAGYLNTSGHYNVFTGFQSGYSNNVGRYNVFSGYQAGYSNTADYNTFNGYEAGRYNTTGAANVFTGANAGKLTTIGSNNTYIGYGSGSANTTGRGNTLLGSGAGGSNITGSNNTCLGYNAGHENKLSGGVFIGSYAGYYTNLSNVLLIDNRDRITAANDTTKALIFGKFDNNPESQSLTINGNVTTPYNLTVNGYFVSDTNSMQVYTGIFTVNSAYSPTAADTWLRIKMDSLFEADTYGFHLNADSTGIVCENAGMYQFGGHAKLYNPTTGQVDATVGMRLLVNGVEQEEFNTAVSRSFKASGADDLVSAANGILRLNASDTLYIEMKTTSTSIDLDQIGGGFFDNAAVPLTVFLHEIKPIKK